MDAKKTKDAKAEEIPPVSPRNRYLLIAIICSGLFLRLCAYSWNVIIQGDVNLFVLSAREIARHDRFEYPMKYEYSPHAPYKTLSTPATQHTPMWAFSAGKIGKIFHTDNAFRILKVMSFTVGIVILAALLFYSRALVSPFLQNAHLPVILLLATSPLLCDFSANGSPFILCALELLAASFMLARFPWTKLSSFAAYGALCAFSLLTHGIMFSLFISFVFAVMFLRGKSIRASGIFIFMLSFLAVLSPWIVSNLNAFGTPFYSYSRYDILKRLGLDEVNIFGNVISTQRVHPFNFSVIKLYFTEMLKTLILFLSECVNEAGIFTVALCIPGIAAALQRNKSKTFFAALPFLCYALMVMLWATHRHRYLVPALLPLYLAAGIGFFSFKHHASPFFRASGWLILLCAVLTQLYGFLDTPPTRYYADDFQSTKDYHTMVDVAQILKEQPRGAVLGYTDVLVGGVEGVYYHDLPFVHGRDILGNTKALRKLILDFNPRYVWTDTSRVRDVLHLVPSANVFYTRAPFVIIAIR